MRDARYMKEEIYDVYWQGPFAWAERGRIEQLKDRGNVIYSIQGTHPIYGQNVLLYIGMTENTVLTRLTQHEEEWIDDEYDAVTVKAASIGRFRGWKEYESWPETKAHRPPSTQIIKATEALLIYANQPAYNSRNKVDVKLASGIRLFNSGKSGHVLTEVSFGYHYGYDVRRRRTKRDV